MAARVSTVTVSMPKLVSRITLRVRFTRLAGARLRLATLVMRLGAAIGGVGVDISIGSVAG